MWPEDDIQNFPTDKYYFNLKDKIKQESRSLLLYNCRDYIGKTEQDHRMQTSEHIGVWPITGKCVKNNS